MGGRDGNPKKEKGNDGDRSGGETLSPSKKSVQICISSDGN